MAPVAKVISSRLAMGQEKESLRERFEAELREDHTSKRLMVLGEERHRFDAKPIPLRRP